MISTFLVVVFNHLYKIIQNFPDILGVEIISPQGAYCRIYCVVYIGVSYCCQIYGLHLLPISVPSAWQSMPNLPETRVKDKEISTVSPFVMLVRM